MLAKRSFNPKALVGKSLQQGRYVLKQFLGAGSFAFVYRAEEMLGGERLRDVAVKWVVEGDPASILREAQALAAMPPHPNIVTFLTSLTLAPPAQGLLLVLEFVDGKPLDKLLMEGVALPPEDAVRLLDHVMAGLAHAHAHKVVHRDLKPENILSRADGTLKITDFGIARSARAATTTSEDVIKGTPAYMAPEQFGRRHDHRVDLYAAGVMAYEMLVGRRPFVGTPVEIMRGHVMEAPDIPDHLPPPFRDFLGKALSKSPDDRWETAEQMRAALQEALAATQGPRGNQKVPTLSGRRDMGDGRQTAQFTGSKRRAHAAATRPVVLELHPELTPQPSVEWHLPGGSRLLGSIAAQALPGMPRLAQRIAGELEIDSAFRHPAFLLCRALSFEKREVVERFEPYRNQRFPKPVFDSPGEIDPWDPVYPIERPNQQKPLFEFRIPSTDRQVKCLNCRGRGKAPCVECQGEDAPLCDVCKGAGESECAECSGMGDRAGYLLIVARLERHEERAFVKPPPVQADVTEEDLAGAPTQRLMRLNGGVLSASDLPSPFPWPELAPRAKTMLESTTVVGESASMDDELTLDFSWLGHAICELEGEEASVDAVPEGGFATCEPRLLEMIRGRAVPLMTNPALWDTDPGEALSLAQEAMGADGPPEWRDPCQQAALALAQRLLSTGATAKFRDLRRPFSELVALDASGQWKTRWAAVLVAHRRSLLEEVQTALEGDDPSGTLARALAQMADLEMLAQEGQTLFKLALERIQGLLRKAQFEKSDHLVDALMGVAWPIRGANETLSGLRSSALQERAAALQRQCDTGGKPDHIYRDLSALIGLCPELSSLPATLRAFRKRLGGELKSGRIAGGCHWGRRLQEELSHIRPDLSPLFANMLDGYEDGFIDTIVSMLEQPEQFSDAMALLGLPEAKLDEDPRVAALAAAFDRTFSARLTNYDPSASNQSLTEEQQQEVARAIAAWMRLQAWCPRQVLAQGFVRQLWAVLQSVLRGPMHDRAQPLLELAAHAKGIGDHPEVGPLIQAAREEKFQAAAREAITALRERGEFDAYRRTFFLLVPLVPLHSAVADILAALQAHLTQLALDGKAEELQAQSEAISGFLKTHKMQEIPWLRDSVSNQSRELEKFVLSRVGEADQVNRALELVAWLRKQKHRWAEELVIRLDQGLERSKERDAVDHRLALTPVARVFAATDPHSLVRRVAMNARSNLDEAIWRWGMATLVPGAFLLLPELMPFFGVPVPGLDPFTKRGLAAWVAMAAAGYLAGKWLAGVTRFAMARKDPKGERWRLAAALCGLAMSTAAFGAGVAAIRAVGSGF
ncbi:MAG: serine/threonine protein kinase [Candidatus Wallbacteria bacterium]|nr:serine/threonine protein kinase [Candidatus Wallbacteria bacterium]